MTRITKKLLAGAFLTGGLMATGCHHGGDVTKKHGDPCWPDRYANESRAATVAQFQPQVENGHILDQTIWNMHFEFGTDKINGAGMDKLDQLSRRRPSPDQKLYLQTSRDIVYDAEKPNDYATKRVELDLKRTESVHRYLKATLTGRETAFDIQIHDPAYPGIDVVPGISPRVYYTPIPGVNPDTRGLAVPGGPGSVSGAAAVGGPVAAPGAPPAGSTPPPSGSGNSGSMGTRN